MHQIQFKDLHSLVDGTKVWLEKIGVNSPNIECEVQRVMRKEPIYNHRIGKKDFGTIVLRYQPPGQEGYALLIFAPGDEKKYNLYIN